MLCALFSERGKGFHQAALAARNGVLVKNAFFDRFIESADGLHHSFLRLGGVVRKEFARVGIGSAGGATDGAIAKAALLVLTIAFDLGLNVSQVFLQKFLFLLYDSGMLVPPQERYST